VAGNRIEDIVMIGAGNLATHLGLALSASGFNVIQVHNRTSTKGKKLASAIGAEFIVDPGALSQDADLYILAVTDIMIGRVANSLPLNDQLVVHTAGTIEMNILASASINYGVLYPLQTFSGQRKIDFKRVPICVEANSKDAENQIFKLATRLSNQVQIIDSQNRKMLHLSAVFASNFTNFMQVIAEGLLNEHNISFSLLKPLIRQTMLNVRKGHLFRYQTGPAYRGDHNVLDAHRELLASHPEYLELYNLISDNIIKYKALHGKL
jgi:predicted short-subunit dehydrogenase-like oxidoreductase (DUF2520 family)